MLNGQAVYATVGTNKTEWAPTITQLPAQFSAGGAYQIFGTQFNGLSQANDYGDEFAVATNCPLVRIANTATGHVTYAHTHRMSSMGVATGAKIVSTMFDLPLGIETGASTLEVVAHGIPSLRVSITIDALKASPE